MKEQLVRSDIGEGGGGSHKPAYPSFLVHNMDNVNGQLCWAWNLKALWDFLEYKGRIGRTNVILNKKDDTSVVKIMPTSCRSRYFDDGRLYLSWRIRKRLGKYEKVPGLMETLTYDTKRIGKREAWASFGEDTRRFLNAVNQLLASLDVLKRINPLHLKNFECKKCPLKQFAFIFHPEGV